jgi:ATP diphosphatase
MANLARHLDLDPEHALRGANAKFVRRFKSIEAGIQAQGKVLGKVSLAEMEALWDDAKRAEKSRR